MKQLLFFTSACAFFFIGCNTQPEIKHPNPLQQQDSAFVNLTSADTSGQIMDEDDFWEIIDKSRAAANDNYQLQIQSLTAILGTLDTTKIVKFNNTFTLLLAESYDNKLWGASYVINGGCSDDCFDYFREYLIAHGKNKFYQTLKDPESCAPWMKSETEDNWEGINYAASEAYRQKTGKDIPRTFAPEFKLKGKPFDEATVNSLYPKLAKAFFQSGEQ